MVIRQRAMQAEDKQERRDAILDAAERLLLDAPDHIASVAEVAEEAGLAKGTVYLYFPGKDELLLAVHERGIDGFFRAVDALLATPSPVAVDDMLALTRRHLVEPPLFLRLAWRCFGLMAQGLPTEAAVEFKQRMGERLARAGAGLERHFPQLPPGGGVALLRRSYALIMGLWMMSGSTPDGGACALAAGSVGAGLPPIVVEPYPVELDRALRALWQGSLGPHVAAED
jgi:AcrR family transcriptional regulator